MRGDGDFATTPRHHFAVFVGGHAVEGIVVGKDHFDPQAVTIPQIEGVQVADGHPFEGTFVVGGIGFAAPSVDAKDESQPVFFVLPKPGQLRVPRILIATTVMPASSINSRQMLVATSSCDSILPPSPLYLP